MPEQIIRESVIRMLNDIDYNPSKISMKGSHKYLFKNFINGLDEDIDIVDENSFEVFIDKDIYNGIIHAETKFGLTRIDRQGEAIKTLLQGKESPKAWLLVTVYYHSFFCATLLSRLLGRYSCYFSKEEISSIKKTAKNICKKDLNYGNYVGYFVPSVCGGVKIKFKNDGDKPHSTAWKNIYDKVPTNSRLADADVNRYNRIQLFKKILNQYVSTWPLPSVVRNTWNYSDVDLFSKKGDETANEFSSFVGNNRDIEWASKKRLHPDAKNIATSIAFVSSTLSRALSACEHKILR